MDKHPLAFTRIYTDFDGTKRSYPSYMNEADIKAALGLSKKLPPNPYTGRFTYLGTVQGVTIWDRGQERGRRKHRLYALIKDRYIPCGRLHQVKL